MNKRTHHEPIYVFRLTPEISLIWTILGSLLVILAAAGATWLTAIMHKQVVIFSIEINGGGVWRGILVFVLLLTITFATTIIHELVHGIAFTAFGGSPKYGFKFKYFLPLAYATSPNKLFRRHAFIIITLAPLIIIDICCLLLLLIFPQVSWLIWIIAFNTGGAIGDIWIAIQLLRCPQSIRVEDQEEGIAIYAPVSVTRRDLPFAVNGKNRPYSHLTVISNLAFITFGSVLISSFLLIPVLKILEIPSFLIGNNAFWVLRWVNNAKGFSLELNWIFLLVILVLPLIGFLTKIVRR